MLQSAIVYDNAVIPLITYSFYSYIVLYYFFSFAFYFAIFFYLISSKRVYIIIMNSLLHICYKL